MSFLTERGIGLGIWWASSPTRVLGSVGWVWLITLGGNPVLDAVGGWSRTMSWGIAKGSVKGAWAGLAFTARTTWSRLILPAVLSTPVQTAAIIAAPVVVAAVGAAVVTAAQQKAGLIGPSAPTATSPFPSLKGTELNPFFVGMGTVV